MNAGHQTGNSDTEGDTFGVENLTALQIVSGTLDFTSLALGAISTDKEITIRNTGNDAALDVNLDISDMDCNNGTGGTIPKANLKVSIAALADDRDYATEMTAGGASVDLNMDIPDASMQDQANNDETGIIETVYFKLGIPDEGVRGTCEGTVIFTAT